MSYTFLVNTIAPHDAFEIASLAAHIASQVEQDDIERCLGSMAEERAKRRTPQLGCSRHMRDAAGRLCHPAVRNP